MIEDSYDDFFDPTIDPISPARAMIMGALFSFTLAAIVVGAIIVFGSKMPKTAPKEPLSTQSILESEP